MAGTPSLPRPRGGLEDLQHPAALRLLCAGGALVAAGLLMALSLRVAELPGWGANWTHLRGAPARWRPVRGHLGFSVMLRSAAAALKFG